MDDDQPDVVIGNGGFAGSIDYAALTTRSNEGYAVAGYVLDASLPTTWAS